MMNLLSKETLIGAGALGAGAVIAKVVQKKVLPLIPVGGVFEEKVAGVTPVASNLATLLVGIVTPMALKGSFGKGLGAGMIAVSVAGLVTPLLETAGIPLTGYNDTLMGNVMMGEVDNSNGVLMGATEDTFDAPYNDTTAGNAGEADF
jgi:hypothetical protein